MKKLILLIALGFISATTFAQAPLEVGRAQLNAGFGISDWGIPVYFGVDYGIAKDWTIGGQLSFQDKEDSYHGYHYNSTAMGIGANGNYHFNRILEMPSNFDFYAGANLTFFAWNYNDYNGVPHPDHDSVGLGLQVGGRYFFTKKFGINLEFGGNSGTTGGAKFGVTFKL
jgi:hypothetical protein